MDVSLENTKVDDSPNINSNDDCNFKISNQNTIKSGHINKQFNNKYFVLEKKTNIIVEKPALINKKQLFLPTIARLFQL